MMMRCDMRGWFVCDNGVRFLVDSVVMILPLPDGVSVGLASGRSVLVTQDEMARLIAQIEAEESTPSPVKPVKPNMFHHDGGGFLLSEVRSYCHVKRGPPAPGMATIEAHISVQMGHGSTACSARVSGSDIPRFLAAMGVPNEPT